MTSDVYGASLINGARPTPPQVTDLRQLPALEWLTAPEHVRWVLWKYVWKKAKNGRKGKWDKVPHQINGDFAASNNPSQWSTYDAVWNIYCKGGFAGVGLMLLGLKDVGLIDLDDVRNPLSGDVLPWAQKIIDCESYHEITPSMGGFRLAGSWSGGKVHHNTPHHPGGGHFELFSDCERYVTFTGAADGTADLWGSIDEPFGSLLEMLGKPNGANGSAQSEPRTETSDPIDIQTLSLFAMELITKGTVDKEPVKNRGPQFMKLVRELHGRGHGFEAVLALLAKYPNGVQAKYGSRLRKELSRAWMKVSSTPTTDDKGGVTLDDFYAFMPQHNYFYVPTRQPWPAESVNSRVGAVFVGYGDDGKEMKVPANVWLDRNRPVEQMTWTPGLPLIIKDRLVSEGGWIERKGVGCLNLYMPPTVKLGDAEQAEPWIKHLKLIYPDDHDHIVKFLAHRRQRPQEKINHALVLGGSPGIGKDTLLEPVKHAVGAWNFAEVSAVQVMGTYNSFLKSVILRISEARDLGDFDRFAFYDHMKSYTAAPPDVLRIDEKLTIHQFLR